MYGILHRLRTQVTLLSYSARDETAKEVYPIRTYRYIMSPWRAHLNGMLTLACFRILNFSGPLQRRNKINPGQLLLGPSECLSSFWACSTTDLLHHPVSPYLPNLPCSALLNAAPGRLWHQSPKCKHPLLYRETHLATHRRPTQLLDEALLQGGCGIAGSVQGGCCVRR